VLSFFEEYIKHSALNFAQALHGISYFFSHPDIDRVWPRGTPAHAFRSAGLRTKRIGNDLFFAIIPPHWHHTREELDSMTRTPLSRWFQYGYSAWRFTESGERKEDLTDVDRRWDPRCQEPAP